MEAIDREVFEQSWIETQELMQEFGLPDYDAATKQHEIEVLEAGRVVVVVSLGDLESEPF